MVALAAGSWFDWWQADPKGSAGEEPPEIIKQLFDTVEAWQNEPLGTDRYMELGREMVRINAENLWWYIAVGRAPGHEWSSSACALGNEIRNYRDPEAGAGRWIVELLWIDESAIPDLRRR